MPKVDQELKAYIAITLKDLLIELFGESLTDDQKNEKWLNKKELMEQFGFSATFVRDYGDKLPRTKPDGGGWLYPRNQIQKMMWNGEIKNLSTTK